MNIDRISNVKKSKAFTVLDVIVAVIVAAAIIVGAVLVYSRPAARVVVSADGERFTVPLDTDAVIRLEHLTVHIEGGKVWVTDADCADKICEHTGAISRAGQQIVCLPNSVVITVAAESDLAWELGRR